VSVPPDDADFPRLLIFSGRAVAGGHLQTAITLWFEEKDPASIHTLAIATQGILNTMCKHKGVKRSQINELVEAQSDAVRSAIRAPQNFFKNGRYTGQRHKGFVRNTEMWTELVLVDCLSMHQRLFGTLSPMMLLFALRHSPFNPGAFPIKATVKGFKIEDLRRFSRAEFLKKVLPRFRGKVGDLPPKSTHWEESPE
jgi:hypothetical protein